MHTAYSTEMNKAQWHARLRESESGYDFRKVLNPISFSINQTCQSKLLDSVEGS